MLSFTVMLLLRLRSTEKSVEHNTTSGQFLAIYLPNSLKLHKQFRSAYSWAVLVLIEEHHRSAIHWNFLQQFVKGIFS